MKRIGFVSLVGAGPGDPGLLTLKAMERLREADLVIYDYLVNPEHLRHCRPDCEAIAVGKGFRHKKLPQERINARILQEASRGKKVVRLKGGDPYLFGRGGEEALFLKSNRVAFEVVPGVTSATAVANYAGIPLTHRGHNQSVTLLTGHRASNAQLDHLDWKSIAALPGTLVVYMGFYNLGVIAKQLIRHGMQKQTPVAVIEWGTLPRQRTATGDLATIEAEVKRKQLAPPCLIVIGDVVRLRKHLSWFETLPLYGARVWVTRMRERSGTFSDKLRSLGAQVEEYPMIRIEKPSNEKMLTDAVKDLHGYDWLIFTSAHGVDSFFGALGSLGKDARALGAARLACVGSETRKRLAAYGVKADLMPDRFESEAVAEAMKEKYGMLSGLKILLVRSQIAHKEMEKSLMRWGAKTTAVTGYRTLPDRRGIQALRTASAQPPDYLTFTSSSCADVFVKALGRGRARTLAKRARIISIGPATTKTLRGHRLRVARQAEDHHVEGVIEAMLKDRGRAR